MAGLQRSAVSFRRQGSSGLVWDDRFISGELNRVNNTNLQTAGDAGGVLNKPVELDPDGITKEQSSSDPPKLPSPRTRRNDPPPPIETVALERNRSAGGGGRYRTTGRGVSPAAIEPPSPKVSACGFCAPFGGKQPGSRARKKARHGNNRRSR